MSALEIGSIQSGVSNLECDARANPLRATLAALSGSWVICYRTDSLYGQCLSADHVPRLSQATLIARAIRHRSNLCGIESHGKGLCTVSASV